MGWWRADENGQIIECDTKCLVGDAPADAIGDALDEIIGQYRRAHGRAPTLDELDRCWRFVTGPYRRGEHAIGEPWNDE